MVSVTCDTWTSPNHKSILGVTAHWIDSDWVLRDLVIAVVVVEGDHSGANLGRHMVAIFEEYGLGGKLFCITADNASSNKVMGRHIAASGKMRGFDTQQNLLGCMAHVINLSAKAGIKALGGTFADDVPAPRDDPIDVREILGERTIDSADCEFLKL